MRTCSLRSSRSRVVHGIFADPDGGKETFADRVGGWWSRTVNRSGV